MGRFSPSVATPSPPPPSARLSVTSRRSSATSPWTSSRRCPPLLPPPPSRSPTSFPTARSSQAGVFSAMTAPLPADCTEQKPTQDLSPDCLEALSSICLAQAQDCVLRKAVRDQKKAAVVAKLAAHAKVLYLQTNLSLGRESVRGMWERDWTTTMEQRASLCRGLAELHQASVCQEQGRWGERIARLRVAKASLAAVPEWLARAETALAEAVKDNDFIYHDRVPDAEQLEPVAPAAVVKATPLPERWRPGEADLFKEMPAWADVKLKPVECVVS